MERGICHGWRCQGVHDHGVIGANSADNVAMPGHKESIWAEQQPNPFPHSPLLLQGGVRQNLVH